MVGRLLSYHECNKQLDHFHQLQMYGLPVARPQGAIVLRSHWNYTLKREMVQDAVARGGCRRTDYREVYPLGDSPHSSFNLNRIRLPCLVGCLEEYNNTY